MEYLKLLWLLALSSSTVYTQDKIPVTMVTTHSFNAKSINPYPEYLCYLSSPGTNATVTSRRVVELRDSPNTFDKQPPSPVRVTDRPYPAGSAVYRVSLDFTNTDVAAMGVFSCDVSRGGRTETIVSNVLMDSGTYSHPRNGLVTQTVNVGDTDEQIRMSVSNMAISSWERNGMRISYNQDFDTAMTNINTRDLRQLYFVPKIIKSRHEGIYSPIHSGEGPKSSFRGIKRVIVRSCPANHWAPPDCHGVCDYCYNGGVCDDDTGRCICPPAFMGPNCLTACGGNKFGPSCEFQCSYDDDANEDSCLGLQFCLVDPFGCRCATGFGGLDCQPCSTGRYGASCLTICSSQCNGDCDRFTGACNGTCKQGWTGTNCQIPIVCPVGYYGINCTEKCYCKNDTDCDKITGECPNRECAPPYQVQSGGVKCQECQGAVFGDSCLEECHCAEEYCDKVSGRCRGPCLPQWLDSYYCLAGLKTFVTKRFNPGTITEVSCVSQIYGSSDQDLTTYLSRKPDQIVNDSIELIETTKDGKIFETKRYRVGNITNGEKLYCMIVENTAGGIVANLSATVYEYVLPTLSSPPSLLNADTTFVTIQWDAWNEDNDVGDPPLVAYIPYYRAASSNQWIRGEATESLTFTASNLSTDTLHELSVAAVREGKKGEGPMSPVAQLRTKCDVSGTSPINVATTIQDGTIGSVNVSWQKPDDIDCTTGISFFFIYLVEDGKEPVFRKQVKGNGPFWTIVENLEEGNYSFLVTLVIDGESDFSPSTARLYVQGVDEITKDTTNNGGIVAIIVILIFVVISVVVIAAFLYRRKTHDDEEKRLVSYNHNGVLIGGVGNPYTGEEERVKNLGDETESEEEIDDDDEEDITTLKRPADVKVSELREYINNNLQDGKLEEEFNRLHPGKQYPWTIAEKKENKTKNRFRNLYTYDHSRVVLNKLPSDPDSDYYNASFIMTDENSKPFIAAQGPNKASLNDFWRMVWLQDVSTIVMVTNLVEKGRERCLQYWPLAVGSRSVFGNIEVTWEWQTEFADYVIRKLLIVYGSKCRVVNQLHFISWPDMGTPKQPTPLIEFTKHVKLIHKDATTPMLVHCSAGVGRTGTFIALYSLLDDVLTEQYVNVYSFAHKMRESRINMIQTGKQYVYLYKCLLEVSLTTDTEKSRSQVSELAADESMTAIKKEYEILHELEDDTLVYSDYLKKQAGGRRPFSISEKSYNLTFYVNGNLLKSFKKGDAFVTAKHPDEDSIGSIWKLVHNWKCPIMVTLDNSGNKPYWPESGSVKYSNVTVHFKSTETRGPFVIRQFEVTKVGEEDVVTVQHFDLTSFPARSDVESFTDLVHEVSSVHRNNPQKGPTIVLCGDGEAVSGVFCAVLSELERLQAIGKIDVFKTVRQLKETNGDIVPSEMDYVLCYKTLFCYLQGKYNYENV